MCIDICVDIYIYIHICIHISIYVYKHVCVCVCVSYLYIFVYIERDTAPEDLAVRGRGSHAGARGQCLRFHVTVQGISG